MEPQESNEEKLARLLMLRQGFSKMKDAKKQESDVMAEHLGELNDRLTKISEDIANLDNEIFAVYKAKMAEESNATS